jgi:hypothetical protein
MSSLIIISLKEEFEDNKGVIRIQKLKDKTQQENKNKTKKMHNTEN